MPSVQILCPPASFLTGSVSTALTGNIDRAFRRTGMLGTLDGAFISLVPSSTYVWFASTSSFGIHGVDPSTHTNNLGTGYRCLLSGNLTADQVAEHLRYTVSLIPNFTASRINSTATITSSNIFYTASHAGTPWTQRGYADFWGSRQRSTTGNNGVTTAVVAQSAPVPNISGTRLRGMRIGRTVAGGPIRASVYYAESGTSETDPTNARLLYDFGQTQGIITEGYEYVYVLSSSYPIIPQTGVIWLTFKADGGQGNNLYQLEGVTNSDNSNFYHQNVFISDAGSDPTIPFSQTFAYAGSNPFPVLMDAAIMFDSPPFAGAGDLEFRFGNHVSATFNSPNSALITGTLSMRARLPEIRGMRVVSSTVGIGTTHTTQFRGAIYEGGVSIANPNSSTLVVDLGQTAGTAINQYISVAAPTGTSYLTSGAIINQIWKNNDAGIAVLFHFGSNPDPGYDDTPDPPYEPNDWDGASEYETFTVGGGISSDETVAFESVFLTGTTDIIPGNYPRYNLTLRVDGFTFAEGGADPTGSSAINLSSNIFSSTFTLGTSNFILGTSSLGSTIFSSTFTFNNSNFSLGTASLTQSSFSSTFTLGTSNFSLGTSSLGSTIFSSTFTLGTSNFVLGTSSLGSTVFSSTFTLGTSNFILGTSSLGSTIFSSTFVLNNSLFVLGTSSLGSTIFSSTFSLGNSLINTGSVPIDFYPILFSSTFTLGTSNFVLGTSSLGSTIFSSTFIFQNSLVFTGSNIDLSSSIFSSTFTFSNSSIVNEFTLTSSLFSGTYTFQNNSLISSSITLNSSLLIFRFVMQSNPEVSTIRRLKHGGSSSTTKDENNAPKSLQERVVINVKLRSGNKIFHNKVEMISEKRDIKILTKLKN